jgi:hypothetical protein
VTETLRELLREAIEAVHQTGSIRDHSDPNDTTGWNVHGIETCADPLCVDSLAALARSESPSPEGLTEAWAEAEAALPEGWHWMGVDCRPDSALFLNSQDESHRWRASIWHPNNGDKPIHGDGPTPAAALHALAARLRSLPADKP